jgi:UDP-N-acetylglucosamine/UDP-N-acetyl-alpha-D-glucosaminouronate 4-epimerase
MFDMAMKVLVTGGSGFIGSHLVDALLRRGDDVRVLDNLTTGHRVNLAGVPVGQEGCGRFTFMEGDITDRPTVHEAVKGIDYILHQAALPSVQRSVEDPLTSNMVNVEGTLNVLIAARDAGVKRVVYASSSSVYGDSLQLPKVEHMSPNPLSPYAVSKLSAEAYCRAFTRVYHLETVSLRYFNVFGPRQDPDSLYSAVLPRFIEALLSQKRPVIYGDGTQSRDFTFIENVVQANILALEAAGVEGETFNIACGESVDLRVVLQCLSELSGNFVEPEYRVPRAGDVKHSLADISKAEQMLGYRPVVPFREGLQHTLEFFRQRRASR